MLADEPRGPRCCSQRTALPASGRPAVRGACQTAFPRPPSAFSIASVELHGQLAEVAPDRPSAVRDGSPTTGIGTSLRQARPVLFWGAIGLVFVVAGWWRLRVAGDDLFGDELATYWDVTTPSSVLDVVRLVKTDAEITPPLFFVLARVSTWLGKEPLFFRLPSLVAGMLLLPLVVWWARLLAGRGAAFATGVLAAASPFLIYYSAEARAYALMMLCVTASTVCLVQAVRRRRRVYWAGYALASAAAMYSHYTAAFALFAQLVWLAAFQRSQLRTALIANFGAAVLFAPWIPGVIADQNSWTTPLLNALTPLDLENLTRYWLHWSFAYPYAVVPVSAIPGAVGVALLVVGVAVALFGLVVRRHLLSLSRERQRLVALTVMLALANPVLALAVSLVGTHVYGPRNLAASYPALVVLLGSVPFLLRGFTRAIGAAGICGCFVLSGALTALGEQGRPEVRPLAEHLRREARVGDAIVDGTAILSPGPPSVLDTLPHPSLPTFRAGAPEVRDRPFGLFDHRPSLRDALARALIHTSRRGRVFLFMQSLPKSASGPFRARVRRVADPSRQWRSLGLRAVFVDRAERGFARPVLVVLRRTNAKAGHTLAGGRKAGS